jgi:hypothetical protein
VTAAVRMWWTLALGTSRVACLLGSRVSLRAAPGGHHSIKGRPECDIAHGLTFIKLRYPGVLGES